MKKSVLLLLIIAVISSCSKDKFESSERIVELKTEFGKMTIKLYDETPLHRDNFIALTDSGFFNDLLFHRVINTFMIQGGDPDSKNAPEGKQLGEGGPGYQLPAEFRDTIYHKKGVIAAAREGDKYNPEKKSAGSQFYIVQGKVFTNEELDELITKINKRKFQTIYQDLVIEAQSKELETNNKANFNKLGKIAYEKALEIYAESDTFNLTEKQREIYTTIGGTPHLDGNYTVFGEVIKGIEIIDSIAAQKTDKNDRPLEDIKMKIKVIK